MDATVRVETTVENRTCGKTYLFACSVKTTQLRVAAGSGTEPALVQAYEKTMQIVSERINMGSGQVKKMATFNPRKSESFNKAPHVIKMDTVKAHVGCIVEDLELWPAEGRAKQEGSQQDLSGARAVSCEGVKVGRQLHAKLHEGFDL